MKKEDKIALTVFAVLVLLSIGFIIGTIFTMLSIEEEMKDINSISHYENFTQGNMELTLVSDAGYHFTTEDNQNIGVFIPICQAKRYNIDDMKEGDLAKVRHFKNYAIEIIAE